ncbi:hypothetical protein D9757_002761 [Collybiopsis confluens]|uniref:RNI-like protein n=1 Tax=Collybiopsis confluens TaxID=2823264 RepID=A0A8H5HWW8_9AGAR|nr:hypothetical protein D9757_002761 [Collybiopsis confluens]
MSRNLVRGPTSALTEFLRENNITPTTVAVRAAQNQPQPVPGPSNRPADHVAEESEASGPPRRRNRAIRDGYNSDQLDEPEEPTTKRRKAAASTAAAKTKAKKAAQQDESEDDAYTALSKSMRTNVKPLNGSIERCAECQKEFSVSQYTIAATPGPGFLCHPCAKKLGNNPFKKPAISRKRTNAGDKRNVVHFEERRLPTLASMCINLISDHINDVEAFGDIGSVNMEAISKAISKERSLTSDNVHLFYGIENTSLVLYDVTELSPTALITLGYLNPNLTSLRLDYCGLISDEVINSWCSFLPNLAHLQLLGPFLVRAPAWITFFKAHPQLQSFLITQSPRFNLECLQTLVNTSSKCLTRLGLREVGLLSDDFLETISLLAGQLTFLDISEPFESCSEKAANKLLSVLGLTLTSLNLSGHVALTDETLMSGIMPNVSTLTDLTLSNLPKLTDDGVAAFFANWSNPPLAAIDLSRNPALSTNSVMELLNHSGEGLHFLNINGLKDVSGNALSNIAKQAKHLRKLDLGWCREVDDFIMKAILESCKSWLGEVKIWGCNKVEGKWINGGTKTKAKIFGIEK